MAPLLSVYSRHELRELVLPSDALTEDERDEFLPIALLGGSDVIMLALYEFDYPPLVKRLRELFGPETRLCAPVGFRWDGTSRPQFVGALMDRFCELVRATLLHDLLYATELFDVNGRGDYGQREADYWYKELLEDRGASELQEHVRYAAVRAFGASKFPHDVEAVARDRALHSYPGNPWGVPTHEMGIDAETIQRKLVRQVEATRAAQ